MVTMEQKEFRSFCRIIQQHSEESLHLSNDHCKCVVVQTPATGINFLFSPKEIKRFNELLDEADTEERIQSMLELFRQ